MQNIASDSTMNIAYDYFSDNAESFKSSFIKLIFYVLTLSSFKTSGLSARNSGACLPTVWKINRRHSTLVNSNFDAASAISFDGSSPFVSSRLLSMLSGDGGKCSLNAENKRFHFPFHYVITEKRFVFNVLYRSHESIENLPTIIYKHFVLRLVDY